MRILFILALAALVATIPMLIYMACMGKHVNWIAVAVIYPIAVIYAYARIRAAQPIK